MVDDELDVDSDDEEPPVLIENVYRQRATISRQSSFSDVGAQALEQEVEDLCQLDDAFEHMTERFKHRLSARVIDGMNHTLDVGEELQGTPSGQMQVTIGDTTPRSFRVGTRQESESAMAPSIVWAKKNSIVSRMRSHVDSANLVFYRAPIVRQVSLLKFTPNPKFETKCTNFTFGRSVSTGMIASSISNTNMKQVRIRIQTYLEFLELILVIFTRISLCYSAIDWADLFFDLTCKCEEFHTRVICILQRRLSSEKNLADVACFYQLGQALKYDLKAGDGALNFVVLSLCFLDAWKFKTLHDS